MEPLNYSEIPLYLRDGEFYKALDAEDPDDSFDVPTNCYRDSDEPVDTIQDLLIMLNIMSFWALTYYPTAVMRFCFTHNIEEWEPLVAEKHTVLRQVFQVPHRFSLQTAIESGRSELIAFWLNEIEVASEDGRNAIAQACRCGRLDLVQTLHESEYPWDCYAYCAAAQYGHILILNYLHNNGCPLDYNALVFAARGGYLNCMKYLHSISCQWHENVTMEFATEDHYSFLRHNAVGQRPWSDNNWFIDPPAGGYLDCFQFALECNCPLHAEAHIKICMYGLLDCLRLLPLNQCSSMTTRTAAKFGHLNCLTYLHEHGCTWDESTTDFASVNDHSDCLRYAMDFGCPHDDGGVLLAAAHADTTECLKCLIEDQNLYMNADGQLFEGALRAWSLPNVQYLFDIGCPIADTVFTTIDLRTRKQDADMLPCIRFVIEKGLHISEKFLDFVMAWDEVLLQDKYPLCSALIRNEYLPS